MTGHMTEQGCRHHAGFALIELFFFFRHIIQHQLRIDRTCIPQLFDVGHAFYKRRIFKNGDYLIVFIQRIVRIG